MREQVGNEDLETTLCKMVEFHPVEDVSARYKKMRSALPEGVDEFYVKVQLLKSVRQPEELPFPEALDRAGIAMLFYKVPGIPDKFDFEKDGKQYEFTGQLRKDGYHFFINERPKLNITLKIIDPNKL